MGKDSKRPSTSAEVQEMIDRALRLAVDNLHLTLCGIDQRSLPEDCKKTRLDHIALMSTLIARHVKPDSATIVSCEKCRAAVEKTIAELEQ